MFDQLIKIPENLKKLKPKITRILKLEGELIGFLLFKIEITLQTFKALSHLNKDN